MKQTTKYVALDVHQATTVTTVREETGRVIARGILPTTADPILEYFRGMRGTVHVAFEEGTQAQWLYDLLEPVVHRVIVCNRRGESSQGNKADQRDADQLSDLLRQNRLRAVYHGSQGRAQLKEMARAYLNLVEDSTRVMLRLKGVFRARGIKTPGTGVYRVDRRADWLRLLAEPGARFRAEALYGELAVLQQLRPKVKAAMVAEARRDPAWPILRSIPFFGPVRIAQLLAIMQTPWRFRTKRHLWSYAGFAVVTRTSGEYDIDEQRRVRRRRRRALTRGLNRQHNRVLKRVFKSAAHAVSTHDGALRDWYQGLLARGMRPELARVTLARKLAAITLHVWKTGEHYDPAKLTVQAS